MLQTKIYAEVLEDSALEQFNKAMALECNVQGALMADAHLGYTLPIGAVIKSKGMVFPSYVSTDIGCGLCAVKLDITKNEVALEKVKKAILRDIPLGRNRHTSPQMYRIQDCTAMASKLYVDIGQYQLGTLGGGNHFIELAEGEDKKLWIVIHSGSRGFGAKIAYFYMELAATENVDISESMKVFEDKNILFKQRNPKKYNTVKEALVKKFTKEEVTKNLESHVGFSITSKQGQDYLKDMDCALDFALANRKAMVNKIVNILGNPKELMFVNRNHNHAEIVGDYVIHRKGATHANKGMLGVIPGNMKDGSFIVKGKGNEESLCSSSHGAGRVFSRREAKRVLSLEEFNNSMKGVTTNHTADMLDEAPLAYKNIFEVMELQKDLVEVIDRVIPILNIKG